MRKEKTGLEKEIEDSKSEIANLSKEHEEQVAKIENEISVLKASIAELDTTKEQIGEISKEIETLKSELKEGETTDALKAKIGEIKKSLEDAENKNKELERKRKEKDDFLNLLEFMKISAAKFKNSKGTYDLPIITKDGTNQIKEFQTSAKMFEAYQKYLENMDGEGVQVDENGIKGKMKETDSSSCIIS